MTSARPRKRRSVRFLNLLGVGPGNVVTNIPIAPWRHWLDAARRERKESRKIAYAVYGLRPGGA